MSISADISVKNNRHPKERIPVFFNCSLLSNLLINRNALSILADALETDDTVGLGKQRVVASDTDVHAGVDFRSALANEDVAC